MRGRMPDMKSRKLQIAWSVGLAIACLLLLALWVRSYWRYYTFTGQSASQYFGISAGRGRIIWGGNPRLLPSLARNKFGFQSMAAYDFGKLPGVLGFHYDYEATSRDAQLVVPIWFCVVAAATIAVAPFVRWRFTLGTLLIVMTLVAAALGLIAAFR